MDSDDLLKLIAGISVATAAGLGYLAKRLVPPILDLLKIQRNDKIVAAAVKASAEAVRFVQRYFEARLLPTAASADPAAKEALNAEKLELAKVKTRSLVPGLPLGDEQLEVVIEAAVRRMHETKVAPLDPTAPGNMPSLPPVPRDLADLVDTRDERRARV